MRLHILRPNTISIKILAALAALFSGMIAHADLFGRANGPELATGCGFDPRSASAKDCPFANSAVAFESNGVQGFEYKVEIAQSLSSSTQESFFGVEFQARKGFIAGRGSVSTSSARQAFKSDLTVFLYAKVDYGSEYLVDTETLTPEASALRNNPAGWIQKYGTQVVTRRRRGALAIAQIKISHQNSSAVSRWGAKFSAQAGGMGWSAGVSTSMQSLIQEAMDQLDAVVILDGYGGNHSLLETPGDERLFSTHWNRINAYIGSITRETSLVTGYQTASFKQYVTRSSDPFSPSPADIYLRYIDLQAKAEELTDFISNAWYSHPWLNADQVAAYAPIRDLCQQRADQAWALGEEMMNSPKTAWRKPIPDDVPVRMPRIGIRMWNVATDNGWKVHIDCLGGHRLKGEIGVTFVGWFNMTQTETPEGCSLEVIIPPGAVPVLGWADPVRIFDENNRKLMDLTWWLL